MHQFLKLSFFIMLCLSAILLWKTLNDLAPPPETLSVADTTVQKFQVLDRHATPLTMTYQNNWNIHDYVPLHEIPELLQHIFIVAEDKRFYEHNGPDWQARWHAIFQNLKALEIVRGASTISEQTVRILHPRPRIFWSRWLEGFEATQLEKHFSKADILEFYLNQVPYVSQRRGVVQAARHYFDRDLETLNIKEMMALATLVRAPSRLDLHKGQIEIEAPITRLAERLLELGFISQADYQFALTTPLQLHRSHLPVQATHFIHHIYTSPLTQSVQSKGRILTTLDATIQRTVQKILDQRVQDLQHKNVNNGAVLVVENQTGEVLAWANAGAISPELPGSDIDAITTPRQPGSTLKPFLYALALKKGWNAATMIDDSPLAEAVGTGIHHYRNYSRHYYGLLRLRQALGNSLNIPAIRTIQFVGADQFLLLLRQLGMLSLTAHPDHYGDGLALGNGGVTLFELVQAYVALANHGVFQPLTVLRQAPSSDSSLIFSPEIASIIANILSDSEARRLEFGSSALLRFPVQTAVKTGTSNDYRDAWTVGFNYRYTVGAWLGNLDQKSMSQISGSTGPALMVRTIFAELNRYEETQPLYINPQLVKVKICRKTGQRATEDCPSRIEWFVPGTEPLATENPKNRTAKKTPSIEKPLRLKQPSHGLQLAMDPRIPDEFEVFKFLLTKTTVNLDSIEWLVNEKVIATTTGDTRQFMWPLEQGTHTAQAKIWPLDTKEPLLTPKVTFYVK